MTNEQSPQKKRGSRLVDGADIRGTPLYDRKGDEIAALEDLVIDAAAGKTRYALLRLAGTSSLRPLPWEQLRLDVQSGSYSADISDRQLRQTPSLKSGDAASGSEGWRQEKSLIPVTELADVPLTGTKGQKLGCIREVIIDRASGQIVYALMESGNAGTAAPESHAYPLPWALIIYDHDSKGFRLELDPEHLKRAPVVQGTRPFDWEDRVWAERLHEHYGVQPRWTLRSVSP